MMYGPIGRRGFLRGAAAGGAAAGIYCRMGGRAAGAPPLDVPSSLLFHSPPMRPFADDLPMLPIVRGDHLDLAAASATH